MYTDPGPQKVQLRNLAREQHLLHDLGLFLQGIEGTLPQRQALWELNEKLTDCIYFENPNGDGWPSVSPSDIRRSVHEVIDPLAAADQAISAILARHEALARLIGVKERDPDSVAAIRADYDNALALKKLSIERKAQIQHIVDQRNAAFAAAKDASKQLRENASDSGLEAGRQNSWALFRSLVNEEEAYVYFGDDIQAWD